MEAAASENMDAAVYENMDAAVHENMDAAVYENMDEGGPSRDIIELQQNKSYWTTTTPPCRLDCSRNNEDSEKNNIVLAAPINSTTSLCLTYSRTIWFVFVALLVLAALILSAWSLVVVSNCQCSWEISEFV